VEEEQRIRRQNVSRKHSTDRHRWYWHWFLYTKYEINKAIKTLEYSYNKAAGPDGIPVPPAALKADIRTREGAKGLEERTP
jgi:hypothetical protein